MWNDHRYQLSSKILKTEFNPLFTVSSLAKQLCIEFRYYTLSWIKSFENLVSSGYKFRGYLNLDPRDPFRLRASFLIACLYYVTGYQCDTINVSRSSPFLSISLENLEVRSDFAEGQFVFFDVLVENVTIFEEVLEKWRGVSTCLYIGYVNDWYCHSLCLSCISITFNGSRWLFSIRVC